MSLHPDTTPAQPTGFLSSSFWLAAWACGLSLAWLIPNRSLPWTYVHADLWVALMLCLAGLLLCCYGGRLALSYAPRVVSLVALLPVLQHLAGGGGFAGEAWIAALYLGGLAMAIALGSHWEALAPGKAADALFLAIGVAAVISVGFQLFQWLGLDALGIWLNYSPPERAQANFGQPNNLATFLVWGALAIAWAYHRRQLGGGIALLAVLVLAFGMALTQSRTAVLSVTMVAVVLFFLRNRVSGASPLLRGALVLWAALLLFRLLLPVLADALGIAADMERGGTREAAGIRLAAYQLFLGASMERPFGYGWGGIGEAFFRGLDGLPIFPAVFYHTHNLFLDLLVAHGWVIGSLLILAGSLWFVSSFRKLRSPGELLPFLALVAAACHSMLEYPHHYAAFLLPVGVFVGVIDQRLGRCSGGIPVRWGFVGLVIAFVAMAIVARDCFIAEERYNALRFHRLRIGLGLNPLPSSDFMLLNQLDAYFSSASFEPLSAMTDEQIDRYQRSLLSVYDPYDYLRLVQALALAGRTDEAQQWVDRMRKTRSDREFTAMSNDWSRWRETTPSLPALIW
jgi:hypothetical protein